MENLNMYLCSKCKSEWPENYCPACGQTIDRPVVQQMAEPAPFVGVINEAVPKGNRGWEVTRQKGMWRYIFYFGVLAWGVPMFVVMTFLPFHHRDKPLSAGMILMFAGIWALCGAGYGFGMWSTQERKYLKSLKPKPPQASSMDRAQFNKHRRRAMLVVAVIFFFEVIAFGFCYFTSTEKMRPLYLVLGIIFLSLTVVCAAGMLWLFHSESAKIDNNE